jgi:hypothetical protein
MVPELTAHNAAPPSVAKVLLKRFFVAQPGQIGQG